MKKSRINMNKISKNNFKLINKIILIKMWNKIILILIIIVVFIINKKNNKFKIIQIL